MPQTAWIVEKPDGEFRKVELDRPTIGMHQVLVRISASGVNPLDTKIRAGQAAHARQPLPAVLGLDMAGTVEAVGSGVTAFRPGDEVYGMVGGVGGLQGTLAEFIAADADLLAHKPKNLSMRQAAALPLSIITAWEGLVDRAKVHAGQRVLIHAGAGGVGHVAIQLARAFGAEVFATVSPDKKKIVEGFGATPIDYRATSVEEYVATHTQQTGFDIVYDTVEMLHLPPSSCTPATLSAVLGGDRTRWLHFPSAEPHTQAHALVASGSFGKVVIDLQN